MKTRMDYDSLKKQLEKDNRLMALYNNLRYLGIPLRKVHFYETPSVSSGYSMGEKLHVECGHYIIESIDQTREYAKSCKWSATHGLVTVSFNKKSLRKYVDLCESYQNARESGNTKEVIAIREEIKTLVKASIVERFCRIKNLTIL